MGFGDRLGKIFGGLVDAVEAPFGLVKDLATAPFKDEADFDGLLHTINKRGQVRMGQVFGNLFGPQQGVGAAIGAIPQGVRTPVRQVLQPISQGAEWIYKNVISEPIATTLLTAQGKSLTEAYSLAQKTSMGQSAAMMLGLEPGTDGYQIVSGSLDAAARWFLDPTVVGGKALKAGKLALVTKPIEAGADVAKIAESGRVTKFLTELEGKSAAEIRGLAFPDHAHGAAISQVLADAEGIDNKRKVIQTLMGDLPSLEALKKTQSGVAGSLERLIGEQDFLAKTLAPGGRALPVHPSVLQRADDIAAEVDNLYHRQDRLNRLEGVAGMVREQPRISAIARTREGIVRSDFYQKSWMTRPLRATFMMRSEGKLLNFHEAGGDVLINRMTRRAGLDTAEQDLWRNRYLAAANPGERMAMAKGAEDAAVRAIASKAGMTTEEIDGLLAQAGVGRQGAMDMLKSRRYDGKGRSVVRWTDEVTGVAEEIHLPAFVTQEQNLMPLVDLDKVAQATRRVGQFRLRHPNTKVPLELMEGFQRVWKPSVLLRAGWPIRVVGDEQLRILAKIGALSHLKELGTAAYDYTTDMLRKVPRGQRGMRDMEINGYRMEGAFGAPGDVANIFRERVSSNDSFRKAFGSAEMDELERLRADASNWRSIAPGDAEYARSWEHAVNKQFGKDEVGRMFLGGKTVDEVEAWMRSAAGKAYTDRLPYRRGNLREWAQTQHDIIADYTLGDPTIMKAALRGGAKADEHLVNVAPDMAARPIVHGEVVAQATGKSNVLKGIQKIVDRMYENLGRKPTDYLSRNRYFHEVYSAEAERLIGHYDEQAQALGRRLGADDLTRIEGQARIYALGEVKTLLYDLAEESQLSHILRFAAPFYSAWQEVLSTWAKIAVEEPAYVARMRLVWQAPEKAGLITDENGAVVRDEIAYDPVTGKKIGPAGKSRMLTMKIPEWANDVPGLRGLKGQGAISFNRDSLSFLTQGTPGAGVIVQIPVNEIVKDRPELENAVKFILPYGTTPDVKDLILPATAKRAVSLSRGDEDRAFRNAKIRIYQGMQVDYTLGKTKDKPSWEKASDQARAFFNVRLFASYVSPAAITFQSPYQLQIDAYRRGREALAADPHALADDHGDRTVDEWFLDTYGAEFFPLTESLTQSVNGVPPTVEAYKAGGKYAALIKAYPELGSLIVGEEGAGEFSRAVYDGQFAPDAGGRVSRRQKTEEEIQAGPDVREGWLAYRKLMDLLDAERMQRGLPNYQVKAAGDLALMKRLGIAKLQELHPDWAAEFGMVDQKKWTKRVGGMQAIASDKRLAGRPEIKGLRLYLEARDIMVKTLAERKASTLTAASNQDLATAWESITHKLADDNPPFADLFFRWLEHDPVTA